MTTTITKKPISEKQIHYIASLLSDVYGENGPEAMYDFMSTEPTTADASKMIDTLRAKKFATKVSTPTGTVPNGIHMIDGFIIRIRTSKSGNQYAERLLTQIEREEAKKQTGEDTMWLYEGRKGMKGASATTLLTLAQAKAYGKAYGVCAKCGALLSDPDSVEAGIGPVCATKF